jgi:hypothetical protein
MVTEIVCLTPLQPSPQQNTDGAHEQGAAQRPWRPNESSGKSADPYPGSSRHRHSFDVQLFRSEQGTLGISVSLQHRADAHTRCPYVILALAPGGSAQGCGMVEAGDLIHGIDGYNIEHLPFSKVASMLRGRPHSAVRLSMSRPSFAHVSTPHSNDKLQAIQHVQLATYVSQTNHQRLVHENQDSLLANNYPSPPREPRSEPWPADTAASSKNYDTSKVVLSSWQTLVINKFKDKIECADTQGLLSMHDDIVSVAASVNAQSPHAAMGLPQSHSTSSLTPCSHCDSHPGFQYLSGGFSSHPRDCVSLMSHSLRIFGVTWCMS